jgi:hypothetical protein
MKNFTVYGPDHRIESGPAFERTRENQKEFARAANKFLKEESKYCVALKRLLMEPLFY